jgi:beta-lactamase regulating signal transducer with metallopeptidase domain/HEAT repeat protein
MPASLPSAFPALVLLLKATCLLVVALAASLLLQRASAGSRHLVWLVALAGLLVLPAVAAWAPLPLRVLPQTEMADMTTGAAPRGVVPAELRSAATTTLAAAPGAMPATVDPSPVSSAGSRIGLGATLAAAWALVALALALHLAYGAWSVRRIIRRARPLDAPEWQTPLYEIADRLGLDAAPRLLRSDDVKMPFAAGLLSSTIVLPAESDGWSAERRSAVLIHELGHVRRRDLIGHTVGRVACALYWFHPLVWTAARRLRAESERACDDLALVFGARPSEYAEHLLEIVTCVRDHATPSVALAMAHRREFEGRMLAILNPELSRRSLGRTQSAALVGGLAALALVVGAAAPVPRTVARLAPTTAAGSTPDSTVPAAQALEALDVLADADSDIARASDIALAPVRPATAAARERSALRPARAVRTLAADTGTGASDQRAEVLAKLLRGDTSASVRRVAAWGLHRYAGVGVALEALVAAAGGDSDATVREMAAWSLAEAGESSAAAGALVKALRQDKDPGVRATATWALGELGDASAVEALTGVLADADADTREVAAWSIGSCEPSKAPAALVSALGDRDRDVRLSAAWALYNIGDAETTDALEAAYRRETDPEVRIGLIRALGAMADRSVDALQRLVTASDTAVRAAAVAELAGGGASGPWPWPRPEPRPFP